MLTTADMDTLLTLARMDIPAEEKEKLQKEVGSILSYIDQLKKAAGKVPIQEKGAVFNVLRDDDHPISSGTYTKRLLDNALETQDGYIKVKKIL